MKYRLRTRRRELCAGRRGCVGPGRKADFSWARYACASERQEFELCSRIGMTRFLLVLVRGDEKEPEVRRDTASNLFGRRIV